MLDTTFINARIGELLEEALEVPEGSPEQERIEALISELRKNQVRDEDLMEIISQARRRGVAVLALRDCITSFAPRMSEIPLEKRPAFIKATGELPDLEARVTALEARLHTLGREPAA